MKTSVLCCLLASLTPAVLFGQEWRDLLNGKNLDGWEVRGDSVWTVLKDGALVGQRTHPNIEDTFGQPWPLTLKQYKSWLHRQSWLYTTRKDFGEFDLHVEYWIPPRGNSGVSIRDVSRAHYAIGEPDTVWKPPTTLKGSPAHVGYEIQILASDGGDDKFPSGSIYNFVPAKTGAQKSADWNSLDIESRNELIRVRLNGELVAEGPGDPQRSKTGPIGLQLHDQFTFALFRNIRIREAVEKH
jgi:hypothetical protein